MKSPFETPHLANRGTLRTVSASASEIVDSDRRLKKDVEPYQEVLPRLNKLTGSNDGERGEFVEPSVQRGGSLREVTAVASQPLPSDARLKTDVEEYDSVLVRLKDLG